MEDIPLTSPRMRNLNGTTGTQYPKSPREPMEFLSRSWSVSALEVSKALAPSLPSCMAFKFNNNSLGNTISIPEDVNAESEENSGSSDKQMSSSSSSSATSQLLLERIMSQSEVSPLTSGRLSHSSGPLHGTESPPISPSEEFDDVVKFFNKHNTLQPLFTGGRASAGNGCSTPGGTKTLGRWLKERKEKKKEETRAHNAQLHAAISVAAVAAAVAAIAAATAASSASRKNEQPAKTDMAVASAATLVAAQCVESAEAMGAEREHLASVISSAVNVHSCDDITTLTAAAATALRGAATLKARALKEVWNIATVIPVEKTAGTEVGCKDNSNNNRQPPKSECKAGPTNGENFLDICHQEYLAKGGELLKRTRKGDIHWKIVSVYIHRTGQVMLKMKSKHMAGTITKKKKNVVLGVCRDIPAWPDRHLFHNGEQHYYFGLKTATRGVIEFECRDQREYEIWTQGITKLLSVVADEKQDVAKLLS